jgi:magnesium transporter
MPKDIASEVFIEMSADVQKKLIDAFTDKELADTLSELYLDDTVDIIEEMPALVVKRILKNSAPEDRSAINQLLKYPKGSAGSIMTTEYVRLKQDMTVDDALAHIRKVAIDKETIYTCYVTANDRRLLGIVTARSLMISRKSTPISEIMADNVIFAETTESEVDVADKFNKYGFIALPVVDAERRLVGIITVDDAMDVMREKTEEDFARMAAITPSDTDYLKTSFFSIFKSRIPWLLILMISATFSSAILSFFESSLIPALVLFVPMLMDTGGNSGSQASVTAIRGLSTKEIETSDVLRVLKKEFIVGILCGVCLGIVSFGKVMLVDRLIMGNEAVTVSVALALSVSLMATIILAKVIGCSLPLFIKRIGFDPAVMASPFITTIVDALGLIVYFIISANVFGLTV